jgi:hypothetical protein
MPFDIGGRGGLTVAVCLLPQPAISSGILLELVKGVIFRLKTFRTPLRMKALG